MVPVFVAGFVFGLLDKNYLFERVKLSLFINGLLANGNVVVPRTMTDFEPADLEAAESLLLELYEGFRWASNGRSNLLG